MKHSPPDGPTMQEAGFRCCPPLFRLVTWGKSSRSIPRISRDQRLTAAFGCVWLRSVANLRVETRERNPKSGLVFRNQRRAWDSNPRGRVNALMVFKTIAIGH
jgi:hypothetical protein